MVALQGVHLTALPVSRCISRPVANCYYSVAWQDGGHAAASTSNRCPSLKQVFWAVMERGGYETVTDGKQWKEVRWKSE